MLENPIELEKLYQHLRKSEFGMTRPVFDLLVSALIKEGYLVGYRGIQPVNMEKAVMPLSRAVERVVPGELLEAELQPTVVTLAGLLLGKELPVFNIATQEEVWQQFKKFRHKLDEQAQQLGYELTAQQRQATREIGSLTETQKILQRVRTICDAIEPQLPSRAGLRKLIAHTGDIEPLGQALDGFKQVYLFFKRDKDIYAQILRYMDHPALTIPDDEAYTDLLDYRQEVEPLLEFSDRLILFGGFNRLKEAFDHFRDRYIQTYRQEHEKANKAIDIEKLEALRQAPIYQILQRMAGISHLSVVTHFKQIEAQLERAVKSFCVVLSDIDLKNHPRCRCDFALGRRTDAISVAAIGQQIEKVVRDGLRTLQTDPLFKPRITDYMDQMLTLERNVPAGKVQHLMELDPDLGWGDLVPQLQAVIEPEVIHQINRALSGKIRMVKRDIAQLYQQLQGKHHTRESLRQIFEQWMEHGGDPIRHETYIQVIHSGQSPDSSA